MFSKKIDDLLQLARHIMAGLERHYLAVDQPQDSAVRLGYQIQRLHETNTALRNLRNNATLSTKRLSLADKTLKSWLAKARLVVMLARGARWSESWSATGFTQGRTQVPTRLEARITLARALVSFFARHPEFGVGFAEVTAARGRAFCERVVQSCEMLQLAKEECAVARRQHENAIDDLRETVHQLISVLSAHLDANDPRWPDFGLAGPRVEKSNRRALLGDSPAPIPFVPHRQRSTHSIAAA